MSYRLEEYNPRESSTRRSSRTMVNEEDQPEHAEQLISHRRSKTSEKLLHTARGLEAIGFNEKASMYQYGYEDYGVDDDHRSRSRSSRPKTEKKDRKRTSSFIKKLMGGKASGEGNESGSGSKSKAEKA